MKNLLQRSGISRIHLVSPSKQEIRSIESTYDIHELIIEDLTELNTQDKIDIYDDHLCTVLHFPKFEAATKRYILNELNAVLGKDYLITTTRFDTHSIEEVKNQYVEELDDLEEENDEDEKFKVTPYYILYEILDAIYDKNIRLINRIAMDIIQLEE
jgi:magnesium transporter